MLTEGDKPVLGGVKAPVLVTEDVLSSFEGRAPQRDLTTGATPDNLSVRVNRQAVGFQVEEKSSVGGRWDFGRPRLEHQNASGLSGAGWGLLLLLLLRLVLLLTLLLLVLLSLLRPLLLLLLLLS